MATYKMVNKTRHEVLGVYWLDDPERPRFVVVTCSHWWKQVLSSYYEQCVPSAKRQGAFALYFSFHTLYTAMLLYPPFANAILDTEAWSAAQLQHAISCFPILSRKLNPLTIKLSYDYVSPTEKENTQP